MADTEENGRAEVLCTCDPDACEYGCDSPDCAQTY